MIRISAFFKLFSLVAVLVGSKAMGSLSSHPGYVDNVSKEKSDIYRDVNFYIEPPQGYKKSYMDDIFNAQLTGEIRNRYYDKYGQVIDRMHYHRVQNNMVDRNEAQLSKSVEEEQEDLQGFGEYIVKRVSEFHVENLFKNDPKLRPVWEAKEKISKVEVKVGPNYQLKLNYSFVGNFLSTKVENPFCDARFVLEMDPKAMGPTAPQESSYFIGKSIGSKHYAEAYTKTENGQSGLRLSRAIKAQMSASIMAGVDSKNQEESPKQSFGEVGFSWSY